jgi:hypothetical protein
MSVIVNKTNPQEILIASRDSDGVIKEVGTVSVTFAGTPEVATLAITPTSGVAVVGGTTSAVTLTID